MANVNDPLEDKLQATQGPAMPPDVETRVRQRLHAELDIMAVRLKTKRTAPGTQARRFLQKASYAQVLLLVVLTIVAGWVVVHELIPVLQSTWERLCSPSEKP